MTTAPEERKPNDETMEKRSQTYQETDFSLEFYTQAMS